jgi:hypothetical protein
MFEKLNDFMQNLQFIDPKLFKALAILIVGWVVALIIAAIVRGILRRTSLDNKLASLIVGADQAQSMQVEKGIGKGVFYFVMLFVLVSFFQTLGLTMITEPLNALLNTVFEFIPQVAGAAVLLLAAWIIATVLRMVVTKALTAAKLDQRLGGDEGEPVPVSNSLGDAVYWLVFLFFLPAILSTLSLDGLLDPVQGMLDKILGFLPNLVTAAVLVLIGWFVARLVQRIISSLLAAIGVDRLGQRVGLNLILGEQTLSGLMGMVCYIFVLIPVVIAALNALKLDAISVPASDMLSQILSAIPNIFAAVIVVVIAYIIGRLLGSLIAGLLRGIGFDNILKIIGLSDEAAIGSKTPSQIIGSLVQIVIIFFAATQALELLGFIALVDLVMVFMMFAGRVLMGLVIIAIGLYLANSVARLVKASQAAHATLLSLIARIAVMSLALAMGLRQMGLANEIINLAFGLLLGALTVAIAIAFGLGGRDTAAKLLEDWRDATKCTKD